MIAYDLQIKRFQNQGPKKDNISMTKLNRYHREYIVIEKMYFLFILLGLTVALVGCKSILSTQEPRFVDKSFITRQPCEAPCWYGLELNKSTEAEVDAKLSELPFVDQNTIRKWNNVNFGDFSNAIEINYGCPEPKGQICGVFVLSDDLLKIINLRIQYELRLDTVIDYLRPPAYINYSPYTPHQQGCMLIMDWPDQRISARSINGDSYQLCHEIDIGNGIDPTANVTDVYYMVKEAFLSRQCEKYKCPPWPGFKEK